LEETTELNENTLIVIMGTLQTLAPDLVNAVHEENRTVWYGHLATENWRTRANARLQCIIPRVRLQGQPITVREAVIAILDLFHVRWIEATLRFRTLMGIEIANPLYADPRDPPEKEAKAAEIAADVGAQVWKEVMGRDRPSTNHQQITNRRNQQFWTSNR